MVIAASILGLRPQPAKAFTPCERIATASDQTLESARILALKSTPVQYLPIFESIKVEVDTRGRIPFPLAKMEDGRRTILIPDRFPQTSCKLAIGVFLHIADSRDRIFPQLAREAAQCLDRGGGPGSCLEAMADRASERYGKAFTSLDMGSRTSVETITKATLSDILMHEFAHHYLKHFERIRSQEISREDAEFEADLFAALRGVQEHGIPSSMHYFFYALDSIGAFTKALESPDYESITCRDSNIEAITRYIFLDYFYLFDVARGGRGVSKKEFETYAFKRFGGRPPKMPEGTCGRLAGRQLPEAYAEMKTVYARIGRDLDLLYGSGEKYDVERTRALIDDLRKMSREFTFNNGIEEKLVSLILQNWIWKGRSLAPLL